MAKPEKAPTAKLTEYVILRQEPRTDTRDDAVLVMVHGGTFASSAAGAIRKALEVGSLLPGTYMAVPRRSMQPIEVLTERIERLVVRTHVTPAQGAIDGARTSPIDGAAASTPGTAALLDPDHEPSAGGSPVDEDDIPF